MTDRQSGGTVQNIIQSLKTHLVDGELGKGVLYDRILDTGVPHGAAHFRIRCDAGSGIIDQHTALGVFQLFNELCDHCLLFTQHPCVWHSFTSERIFAFKRKPHARRHEDTKHLQMN